MIEFFEGTEYFFLSNFYLCPVEYRGVKLVSSEHGFMMMKTHDPKEKEEIITAPTPGAAKRMGRQCTLRPDWEKIKVQVMTEVVTAKFQQNPELMERLQATGTQMIVEGNHWCDNIWGDCACGNCAHIKGQNLLGKILMKVRGMTRQLGNRKRKCF